MILELLRVGSYAGKAITPEILDQVVKNFRGRVPVTPGHDLADHMPALGWVERVWREGESLYGEVNPNFLIKDLFDLGLYGHWSCGLKLGDEGYYLHHVALLGAVPPAIKDLAIVALGDFADVEQYALAEEPEWKSFFDFDWPVADLDTEWDAEEAKKRIVEKGGWELLRRCVLAVDVSDGNTPEAFYRYAFPVCDIVDGRVKIVPKAVATAQAYLHGARGVKVSPALAKVVAPLIERLQKRIQEKREKEGEKEMSERILDLEQKLAQAQEEIARLMAERKAAKVQELRYAAEGRIPQAVLDKLILLADALTGEVKLSDGETKQAIDLLIEIVRSIPKPTREGAVTLLDKEEEIKWKL